MSSLSKIRRARSESGLDVAGTFYLGSGHTGPITIDLSVTTTPRFCFALKSINTAVTILAVQEVNCELLDGIYADLTLSGSATDIRFSRLNNVGVYPYGPVINLSALSLSAAVVQRLMEDLATVTVASGPTLDLRGSCGAIRSYLSAVTLSGGAGYVVGDTFEFFGHESGTNCLVTVTSVEEETGAITGVEITTPGDFVAIQANLSFVYLGNYGSGFTTDSFSIRNDAKAALVTNGWTVHTNPTPV